MGNTKLKNEIIELVNTLEDSEALITIKNLLVLLETANKPVEEEE